MAQKGKCVSTFFPFNAICRCWAKSEAPLTKKRLRPLRAKYMSSIDFSFLWFVFCSFSLMAWPECFSCMVIFRLRSNRHEQNPTRWSRTSTDVARPAGRNARSSLPSYNTTSGSHHRLQPPWFCMSLPSWATALRHLRTLPSTQPQSSQRFVRSDGPCGHSWPKYRLVTPMHLLFEIGALWPSYWTDCSSSFT